MRGLAFGDIGETLNATESNAKVARAFYKNPVFESSFPDPFILKFGNTYYGYSTGIAGSGNLAFPVIRSRDLVEWSAVGGAMGLLDSNPPHYWAPEVTYSNGQFYLYYSCGNEDRMEIRVATSLQPDGGFVDSGIRLTKEKFAIDPHVFIDDDGEPYLFYATDFLAHTHIGTGTVVDRLLDWFQLEGRPKPVTRARFDWQVYDPRRVEKGNVRWHTVEGPSVLKRGGTYFQMFSGGNWKNQSYGVAYAVSDRICEDQEWSQPIDGKTLMPILGSSDSLVGPGHNSVVTGPNNRELFCVYHSWVQGERRMSIDRLDIVGDRMLLLGPTTTPQMRPFKALSGSIGDSPITFEDISPNFLLDATLRLKNQESEVRIVSTSGLINLSINVNGASFDTSNNKNAFPEEVTPFEFQKLSIEKNGSRITIFLNDQISLGTLADDAEDDVSLAISSNEVDLLNVDLTEGFVDLFENGEPDWSHVDLQDQSSIDVKGSYFPDFEFAANIRSSPADSHHTSYGFVLLSAGDRVEARFDVTASRPAGFSINGSIESIDLPASFVASDYQQFRFVKISDNLRIEVEGFHLATIKVSSEPSRIGIVTIGGSTTLEMVRAVRIGY